MRAVVTGGAGFIGAHLCRRLLEQGHEVVCVDDFSTGRRDNIAPGSDLVETDVCEGVEVAGHVDVVFNLASPASPVDFIPLADQILDVGSRGTAAVVEFTERCDARLVQASTSEVYGDPLVHPQTEEYRGNVNPVGVRAVYDEAKRFGEALVSAHQRSGQLDGVIVRIFNTYGPLMRADDGRVVSNFVTAALAGAPIELAGGAQTRSFCYVDDLVDGLLEAAASRELGPINLGNDSEITVAELASMIVELTGSHSEIVIVPAPPDDPIRRCPDITRARATLGWEPTTSLVDGLARTIEWFSRECRPLSGCTERRMGLSKTDR